jgi:predicted nuclease with TOPRIM domain
MAMPALKIEPESFVEERVAVLEANIEYIRSDISDMKTEMRRLNEKIDGVDQKLSARIDALRDGLANLTLSMEKSFSELKVGRAIDRVWWLLNSAALLGIMARAFKWI